MTDKMVFNSGPPPHIGWWLAGMTESPYTWRWWDGSAWSYGYGSNEMETLNLLTLPQENPRMISVPPSAYMEAIRWSHYWPENARVPRVDPSVPANLAIVMAINRSRDPHCSADAQDSWAQIAHLLHEKALARAAVDGVMGSTLTVRKMKVGVR